MRKLGLALLMLVACSPADAVGGNTACEHFHNVAVDFSDGLLTRDELRVKMKEVADQAVGSPVESQARQMLAEVTSGTPHSFELAVSAMSRACDPYRGG